MKKDMEHRKHKNATKEFKEKTFSLPGLQPNFNETGTEASSETDPSTPPQNQQEPECV